MNRNSKKAQRLSLRLNESSRRLERWTQEGLGPLDDVSEDDAFAHFQTVKELLGRGHSADEVAVRLAARHVFCRRLRDVYVETFGVDEMYDYVGKDPDSDGDDFAQAEALASSWHETLSDIPPKARSVVAQFLDAVEAASETMGEDPDSLVRSFLTQGAVNVMGGSVYNPALLVAAAGDDPAPFLDCMGDAEPILSNSGDAMAQLMDTWCRIDLSQIADFITEATPAQILDAVVDSRVKIEELADQGILPWDSTQIEYFSALFAPFLHTMFDGVEERFAAKLAELGLSHPSELFLSKAESA
jgi:hypothetical protein